MRIGEAPLEIYAPRLAHARRRVEKPNPSSQLADGEKSTTRPRMVIAVRPGVRELSRVETRERDASPIFGRSCAFMAQIIGQALAIRRTDSRYAARAYSVNGGAATHLVDSV